MNQRLVEDSFIERNRHAHGVDMSNKGGWHSPLGMEQRYDSFQMLSSLIEKCANDYCKQTNNKDGLIVYGRISSLVASLGALFLMRGFLLCWCL